MQQIEFVFFLGLHKRQRNSEFKHDQVHNDAKHCIQNTQKRHRNINAWKWKHEMFTHIAPFDILHYI
jgi:hypothetical protein